MGKKTTKAPKSARPPKPRRPDDPAKTSYLFGPGFDDIRQVIASTTGKARDHIDEMTRDTIATSEETSIDSIVIRCGWTAGRYVYWMACDLGMIVMSVLYCVAMLLPQTVAFLLYEFVGLTLCGAAWLFDTLFLSIRRISNVCDYCHKRFSRPVFQCPNCGANHLDLFPGRYGILHHTCQCGQKLPSSVLDRRKPRRKLTAICPYCLAAGHEEIIRSAGSRTICIPVVGGASAGKTSFINAYAVSMIKYRASAHGLKTRFYDKARATEFTRMLEAHQRGLVDKTAVQTDKQHASAFSMSFYIEGAALKPSRLMQLLDIAGETFVAGSENEQQNQYEHCEGIVLVIDPLSIPQVKVRVADGLDGVDAGSISSSGLGDVMNALHNNISANLANNRGKRLTMPLAVVINKVDAAPLLEERLGTATVARFRQAEPEKCSDDSDTVDFLCRQFLIDMDMGDIVDMVQQQFTTSRFFAVSAIGHTAGAGQFRPRGVDEVVDWIISMNDPALAKALAIHELPKTKLPVLTPGIGRFEGIPAEAAQRERQRAAQEQAKAQAKADKERARKERRAPHRQGGPVPVPAPVPRPMSPTPPMPAPAPAESAHATPVPPQPVVPQPVVPQPARQTLRPQRMQTRRAPSQTSRSIPPTSSSVPLPGKPQPTPVPQPTDDAHSAQTPKPQTGQANSGMSLRPQRTRPIKRN